MGHLRYNSTFVVPGQLEAISMETGLGWYVGHVKNMCKLQWDYSAANCQHIYFPTLSSSVHLVLMVIIMLHMALQTKNVES